MRNIDRRQNVSYFRKRRAKRPIGQRARLRKGPARKGSGGRAVTGGRP